MARIETRSRTARQTASEWSTTPSQRPIRQQSPIVLITKRPTSSLISQRQPRREPPTTARRVDASPVAPQFHAALGRLAATYRDLGFSPRGSAQAMQTLRNLAWGDPEHGMGLLSARLDVEATVARYDALCAERFPNTDRHGWAEAARLVLTQLRKLEGIEPG